MDISQENLDRCETKMGGAVFLLGIFLALSGNALGQANDHHAIFNVRNYGAKGDAATDDSVAIATAAAAAAAVGVNDRSATLSPMDLTWGSTVFAS